jgi:hypothetical protein
LYLAPNSCRRKLNSERIIATATPRLTHAHAQCTGGSKLPQNNRKISQTVEGIRGSAQFLTRILASDLSILD